MAKYEEIKRVKNQLSDISIDFVDEYFDTDEQICDAICEFADGKVSIYNSELAEWIMADRWNVYAVEEVVSEGFVDIKDFDLWSAIAAGQYKKYSEELEDEVTNIIRLAALYKTPDYATEEDIEDILNDVDCNVDRYSAFSDIDRLISDNLAIPF